MEEGGVDWVFWKFGRGTIRVSVCHVGGPTGTADSDKVRLRRARCQRWPLRGPLVIMRCICGRRKRMTTKYFIIFYCLNILC